MLDGGRCKYFARLGQYPITEITANAMGYTKPPAKNSLWGTKFVSRGVAPYQIVEGEVNPFRDVRGLPGKLFQASSFLASSEVS